MMARRDFSTNPLGVDETDAVLPTVLYPSPPLQDDSLDGLILSPSAPGSGAFDDAAIGGPVVLPPDATVPFWRMWYNGRSTAADADRIPLPTGAIGAATSPDGVTWTRVPGAAAGGAVLDRAADAPAAWDHLHIGTGSVVTTPVCPPGSSGDSGGGEHGGDQRLTLYYFGGSAEGVTMPAGVWAPVPLTIRGLRMRVGVAESFDDGRSWARQGASAGGMVQDVGADPEAWDALYVGWPHVRVADDEVGSNGGSRHRVGPPARLALTYHSYHVPSRTYRVGGATSSDGGATWTPASAPLLAVGAAGTWDDGGHGTRWVVREPSTAGGRLLMFVEGARAGITAGHSIGVMVSVDGGASWDRASDGPVLAPNVATPAAEGSATEEETTAAAGGWEVAATPRAAWDSISVGCPCVVWDTAEGHWKVYYVGFGPAPGGGLASGIGLAVSAGTDWSVLTRVRQA
ncbi:hypothetical protein MMPV_004398 [Pyropia vietnamensis]